MASHSHPYCWSKQTTLTTHSLYKSGLREDNIEIRDKTGKNKILLSVDLNLQDCQAPSASRGKHAFFTLKAVGDEKSVEDIRVKIEFSDNSTIMGQRNIMAMPNCMQPDGYTHVFFNNQHQQSQNFNPKVWNNSVQITVEFRVIYKEDPFPLVLNSLTNNNSFAKLFLCENQCSVQKNC